MNSLLELINTKMQPVAGKATLADLLEIQNYLPEEEIPVMAAVPQCMWRTIKKPGKKPVDDEDTDEDDTSIIVAHNVILLAWIQLKRDMPELTFEQTAQMISFHDQEAFADFMEEIYWFWSDLSRAEFDEIFRGVRERIKTTPLADEAPQEVAPENPTASESS